MPRERPRLEVSTVRSGGTLAKSRTETSVTPSIDLSMGSKVSKKSSRETCLGTTHNVSISEPGPCTPNRYEPNVKIFPPAALAAASDNPRARETLVTNFLTRAATRPRTISLERRRKVRDGPSRGSKFVGQRLRPAVRTARSSQ